jgi:hypothetical protein
VGLGVGLFLIAIGAILTWAVRNPENGSVNVHVMGVILMLVGLAGFLLSLLFWESWAGRGLWMRRHYVTTEAAPRRHRGWWGPRRRTYAEEAPAPPPSAPPD